MRPVEYAGATLHYSSIRTVLLSSPVQATKHQHGLRSFPTKALAPVVELERSRIVWFLQVCIAALPDHRECISAGKNSFGRLACLRSLQEPGPASLGRLAACRCGGTPCTLRCLGIVVLNDLTGPFDVPLVQKVRAENPGSTNVILMPSNCSSLTRGSPAAGERLPPICQIMWE